MDPAIALAVSALFGLLVVVATIQTAMNTAHIGSTLKRIEKILEERANSK